MSYLWGLNMEIKTKSYCGREAIKLKGIEYPPQERTVFCTGGCINLKFPYIQFNILQIIKNNLVYSTNFYITFSDKSALYDERYSVNFPNASMDGGICLGIVPTDSLRDVVEAFWRNKFTGLISQDIFNKKIKNYIIIPNLWNDEESIRLGWEIIK